MNSTEKKRITILIADDHPLVRSGVRTELERTPQFNIIAEANDGEEAYHLIQALHPDIAILDFQMPKLNGLEISRKLTETESATRVILLTMHRDKKIFFASLDAGVQGYLLKDDAVADVAKAVADVVSGKHFISRDLTELLIEKATGNSADKRINELLSSLTPAEKKLLALVAEMKSNDEIADALFISKRTVENYRVNISDKLQLQSARNLLRFALQYHDSLQ